MEVTRRIKAFVPIAVVALALGGGVGALLLPTALGLRDDSAGASKDSGWAEIRWPFPIDQFGLGKAFQCSAAVCGSPVELYVRAKIGFCNCTTGVADDEELERIGDLPLVDGSAVPLGEGRPIKVAWMKGRSRSFALRGSDLRSKSALLLGYNDRCDAIVALAVIPRDQPGNVESTIVKFLNGPKLMRWAEVTLGL